MLKLQQSTSSGRRHRVCFDDVVITCVARPHLQRHILSIFAMLMCSTKNCKQKHSHSDDAERARARNIRSGIINYFRLGFVTCIKDATAARRFVRFRPQPVNIHARISAALFRHLVRSPRKDKKYAFNQIIRIVGSCLQEQQQTCSCDRAASQNP